MITGDYLKREVRINGDILSPARSLKVVNHSPTGFCWGYRGSGPAQLALALMLEYTLNQEDALALYMHFKDDVISKLPGGEDFEITEDAILAWVAIHLGE